jgi:trk system potassium uptake protein TrkH
VSFTVVGLIISGGLGFAVIVDLVRTQKYSKLTLHARLVLKVTSILLVGAFVLFFIFEFNNPATIGDMTFFDKITATVFQAVTPRTAGFNTLDTASLSAPSKVLTMLLMFIGGSPGSTAGGVKTTTMGMMFLTVYAVARGIEDVEFSKRRISRQTLNKALAVIFVSATVVFVMFMLLTLTEKTIGFEELLFETLSAFGTVGLSLGITAELSALGRILITILMFFGRLGPLTIVLALSGPGHLKKQLLRYPEGKIIVG